MALTQSLTKVGMATAIASLTCGITVITADSASAASFKKFVITGDIFQPSFSGPATDVGDVSGSFTWDGTSFPTINLAVKTTAGPVLDEVYTSFVGGSSNHLSATNTFISGANFPYGIHLAFPSLDSFNLGQTKTLFAGSTAVTGSAAYLPVSGSLTAVPTPALLPGLIGLGVAALRRKNGETAEENA
jgi:hypothetical protein